MEAKVMLKNCSHSPRKMRLLADLIRGMEVDKAMFTLRLNEKKIYANYLEKLIKSGINSWAQKYPDASIESAGLKVLMVKVDGGRMLKRVQPAPQGRAHRVRKRYNHITMVIGSNGSEETVDMATEIESKEN